MWQIHRSCIQDSRDIPLASRRRLKRSRLFDWHCSGHQRRIGSVRVVRRYRPMPSTERTRPQLKRRLVEPTISLVDIQTHDGPNPILVTHDELELNWPACEPSGLLVWFRYLLRAHLGGHLDGEGSAFTRCDLLGPRTRNAYVTALDAAAGAVDFLNAFEAREAGFACLGGNFAQGTNVTCRLRVINQVPVEPHERLSSGGVIPLSLSGKRGLDRTGRSGRRRDGRTLRGRHLRLGIGIAPTTREQHGSDHHADHQGHGDESSHMSPSREPRHPDPRRQTGNYPHPRRSRTTESEACGQRPGTMEA